MVSGDRDEFVGGGVTEDDNPRPLCVGQERERGRWQEATEREKGEAQMQKTWSVMSDFLNDKLTPGPETETTRLPLPKI